MSLIVRFKSKFENLNIGVFVWSIIFGISSWVVFSGIWVESAMLMQKLPEGWKVPSMIGAVSQFAQIGPILLFFLKCKCISCYKQTNSNLIHKIKKHEVSDRVIIYGLFFIGLIAGANLALFWDKTTQLNGQPKSIAFFACVFCLAILDCTCTIVFLTYIGGFKGNYTTALYIGEGISSMLPSMFALLQGVEENGDIDFSNNQSCNQTILILKTDAKKDYIKPRFGVSTYFWLLFSTLVVSFIGFLVLEFWPNFKKEKILYKSYQSVHQNDVNIEIVDEMNVKENKQNARLDKLLLLISITIVSLLMYGFIPGLSSYSAAPYGKKIMHLCSTLSLIAQPIASIIAVFVQIKSTKRTLLVLLTAIGFSSYIISFSFLSPCPPFKNEWYGGVLMICAWVISLCLLMYLRCCITVLIKRNHGQRSLFWCALLTQVGQFIGSVLTYVLVDMAHVFKEEDKCNPSLKC